MEVFNYIVAYYLLSLCLALALRYSKRFILHLEGREPETGKPLYLLFLKAPLVPPLLIVLVGIIIFKERDIWIEKGKHIINLIVVEE